LSSTEAILSTKLRNKLDTFNNDEKEKLSEIDVRLKIL
jgi:hypothetical protein